jgi:hypothetical protein
MSSTRAGSVEPEVLSPPPKGGESLGPDPSVTIQALPSCWHGTRFRSRTEARWAAFFDFMGIGWEYEIEGFGLPDRTRYLPDF